MLPSCFILRLRFQAGARKAHKIFPSQNFPIYRKSADKRAQEKEPCPCIGKTRLRAWGERLDKVLRKEKCTRDNAGLTKLRRDRACSTPPGPQTYISRKGEKRNMTILKYKRKNKNQKKYQRQHNHQAPPSLPVELRQPQ